MKALIQKLLQKTVKNNKPNQRKKVRVLPVGLRSQYLTFTDKNKRRFQAKLIDVSNEGCRVIVSNMQLFEDTSYSIESIKELESIQPLQEQFMAEVIWSDMQSLNGSRYCIAGIRFHI